jgi:hypothetical protein
MVIRLSPTLERRIEREAKVQGIAPERLVENILKQYLSVKKARSEAMSATRRQLDALLRYKKRTVDFAAAVQRAKRKAGRLYEDNAEWIERVS